MTREEAIKQYIMPALKRTWHDDMCIEIISAIEQDPYEVVLDKIKRDIFSACSDNYHMPVYKLDCDEIFGIIDKCVAK